MAAARGARSLRAIDATSSAIDAGRSSASSSTGRRDTATELIKLSELAGVMKGTRPLRADFEVHRSRERVGHRRPLLDVRDQRIDLGLRNAFAFHIDLDPHVGEADGLLADVAGAPDRADVEITLEFEFELVDDPAAVHGVGVQTDRKAGTQRRQ